MTSGHAGSIGHVSVPGDTAVHRLPASGKIVGLVVFVVAVALTPRRAVAAFVVDAAALLAVLALARLGPRLVWRRLAPVVPFLLAAAVVPFVGEGGETVEIAGVPLSVDGCWAAWNIAIKAILGATAAIVLAATTPITDLLRGLDRLRVPAVLVAIVAFMIRYLDIVGGQLRRMRQAMVARCHDPRWLWQVRPIASSAGALFVRSYERGERIHQAMVVRGYSGTMPMLDEPDTKWGRCVLALVPGTVAVGALVVGLVR